MKTLILYPESHFYPYRYPIFDEIANIRKEKRKVDQVKLGDVARLIQRYYDPKRVLSLSEMSSRSYKNYIAEVARFSPDTLFLEMIDDKYIEKACDSFNKKHDSEKVFEALVNHWLANQLQNLVNDIKEYEKFFAALTDEQKALLKITPKMLLDEIPPFKRALYQRWHGSLGELLAIVKNIYLVKTGDTKTMIRQILKKKQFFETAVILFGGYHAIDFYAREELFTRNGIKLTWASGNFPKWVADMITMRKSKKF